jgi:dihydropteroate synthase
MPARKSQKRARARRHFPAVYELAAFSVFGFCIAHGLSRSKFYDMLRKGEGPRLMRCGRRVLISTEAAQAWRRVREHAAAASRKPLARRGRHSHRT